MILIATVLGVLCLVLGALLYTETIHTKQVRSQRDAASRVLLWNMEDSKVDRERITALMRENYSMKSDIDNYKTSVDHLLTRSEKAEKEREEFRGKLDMMEGYAGLLRRAWLNPSHEPWQNDVREYERELEDLLYPYWKKWQLEAK